jgi:two-component system chemotaxis sensor kinase CheA
MSVDLTQFIPSFLEESFEGLELMESSLLNLEQGDDETINSIFRAAHSIKGGAGTFGFDHVTEFTHLVETLLDEMRDGRRSIEQVDVELLLESVDCMRLLLEAIRDEVDCEQDKIIKTSKLLAIALDEGHSDSSTVTADPATDDSGESNAESIVSQSGSSQWQIEFIPENHLVHTGNDTLLLFNELTDLGEVSVKANCKQVPALNDIDPEELYITWQLTLKSDAEESDIREIFEWVEDECQLNLVKEQIEQTSAPVDPPTNEDIVVCSSVVEIQEMPVKSLGCQDR